MVLQLSPPCLHAQLAGRYLFPSLLQLLQLSVCEVPRAKDGVYRRHFQSASRRKEKETDLRDHGGFLAIAHR